MRLVEMPNGEVVEVDDNISEEALNQIRSQFKPTRTQRVAAGQSRKAPLTDEQREVQERVRLQSQRDGSAFGRNINKGIFANFADEITGAGAAALIGIPKAIMRGDPGQITREYRVTRDTERELDRMAQERAPVSSIAGEVAGAVLNPIGTGQKAVAATGNVLSRLGANRAGNAVGNVATRMGNAGAIPQAVMAGATQGAVNAAGATEDLGNVPDAALQGAGVGAIGGGVFGGLTHLGTRGVQTLIDAMPENATRTAYGRVAQLLDNGGITPAQAQREIAVANARGGDAMVQDLTPGLRAQAAAISRRPSVPSSNRLIERGDDRIASRRERFGQQVRDTVDVPANGTDAFARANDIASTRKAAGQNDYREGGVMDSTITPTPQLQTYLREAPEPVQKALRGAYDEMLLRDQNPAGFAGPDGIFSHIPNLRTFDYVKRSFDTQIGQALRSGDKATAQGLSYQLDKLKGVLADANPNNAEYQALLKTQRDLFQQQNALEMGQSVLKRIVSEPRKVLEDLKKLPENATEDARIGIIDALINMDTKADPVGFFRNISRNDAQKKVLEFAFGGRGNLGRFQRWVNRELRATRADVLTAPGRQSETSRIAMAADDEAGGITNVLSNAMRGYAFGGTVGALSGVSRTLQNIASGTSKFAQEEIAKILLSKGDDLVKGVEATKAYQKARDEGNRRRARALGKAGQQLFTGIAGG